MSKEFRVFLLIVLSGSFIFSGCDFAGQNTAEIKIDNKKENQQIAEKLTIKSKKEVSLLFFGDLMFDRYIREVAEKKGNDFVFEKITDLLKGNDLVVANLEGPITDNQSKSVGTVPGEKGHFIFTFNKSLAETLFRKNIKVANIGNNHILNFGENGLGQTKNYLTENGIEYFGDPKNSENNYLIKELEGIRMGFVGYNQFGGKTQETEDNIKILKKKADIVAVYAHWGKEYEKMPSESIKNFAHSFVDNGADLIIGSHPHVVQNMEEYKGKRIYYSLGNFIFDQYFSLETMKGLAVKVMINPENNNLSFQEIPLSLEKNGQTLPK
jgi:poly-gamma-glutamate synthesis protein (capsule biosynthesis protein)